MLYLLAVPSIITSYPALTGSGVDTTTTLSGRLLVHGMTNSGGIAFAPKLIYASGSLPSNATERIAFASGVISAYTGSVLASSPNLLPFFQANSSTGALATIGGNFVSTTLGGSAPL